MPMQAVEGIGEIKFNHHMIRWQGLEITTSRVNSGLIIIIIFVFVFFCLLLLLLLLLLREGRSSRTIILATTLRYCPAVNVQSRNVHFSNFSALSLPFLDLQKTERLT